MLVVPVPRGERVDVLELLRTLAAPVSYSRAHAGGADLYTEMCRAAARPARDELYCGRSCVPAIKTCTIKRQRRRSGRVDGRDKALTAANGSHAHVGASMSSLVCPGRNTTVLGFQRPETGGLRERRQFYDAFITAFAVMLR